MKIKNLEPVIKNVTRWSSSHEMLKRYLEYVDANVFIEPETFFNGFEDVMLTVAEIRTVKSMFKSSLSIQSVTKLLQADNKTALAGSQRPCHRDVRCLFDSLIENFRGMEYHLKADARIVHNPFFESALVKIQSSAPENTLSVEERNSLLKFRKKDFLPDAEEIRDLEFAQHALLLNKRQRVAELGSYIDLSFIPSTTNVVERLFSRAKLYYTPLRKRMTPRNLEVLVFLHCNRSLINVQILSKYVIQTDAHEKAMRDVIAAGELARVAGEATVAHLAAVSNVEDLF